MPRATEDDTHPRAPWRLVAAGAVVLASLFLAGCGDDNGDDDDDDDDSMGVSLVLDTRPATGPEPAHATTTTTTTFRLPS